MDETGFGLKIRNEEFPLRHINNANRKILEEPNGQIITVMETISMTGELLNPFIIFNCRLHTSWFYNIKNVFDWKFSATKEDWTMNEITMEWLRKVFIPQSTASPDQPPVGLILDEHVSHKSKEIFDVCEENNVILIFIPSNLSKKLQPWDSTPFKNLKNQYHWKLNELDQFRYEKKIERAEFLKSYQDVRVNAITQDFIINRWKKTGFFDNIVRVNNLESSEISNQPESMDLDHNVNQSESSDLNHTDNLPDLTDSTLVDEDEVLIELPQKKGDLVSLFLKYGESEEIQEEIVRKVETEFFHLRSKNQYYDDLKLKLQKELNEANEKLISLGEEPVIVNLNGENERILIDED
ncbi:uncharacterized protein KGF55_004049 [Candida pseudojiufengensis]|uniref:uncharacterized protein n=1 Tax=Candida pseudojiufengensis TaxID=497109 RepID=UPI0022258B74|nr:uncharacterized protein KGF55_004049 [Candida pseudojiufengensis]KAI5961426.1 hypothetical protein KGF55_004049 [Candida pseudojiufengensis]